MMSEEEGDDHEFMDLCGDLEPSTDSLKKKDISPPATIPSWMKVGETSSRSTSDEHNGSKEESTSERDIDDNSAEPEE